MRSFAPLLLASAALPALSAASPLHNLVKRAQLALNFSPAAASPLQQSSNYTGAANATLAKQPTVTGKAFDRVIHIWLENTDYDIAMATSAFKKYAGQGVTHTQAYGVTHPSEPNYLADVAGDFFGMADDAFYYLPENITTLFDLLEDGGAKKTPVSYACYQENMPANGFTGFNYTEPNYLTGKGNYVYYVRKHNPCAITNFVSGNTTRAVTTNRNFNQFAEDLKADVLPQWMFITPNLVNDGHDTMPNFFSNWTESFLDPLLADSRFNTNRTIILLTFDENESYGDPNRIANVLLGNGIPSSARGTTDDTYYTHYSDLSTVEANWDLKNLGRGDVNKTLSNVYSTFASALGYTNVNVSSDQQPQLNLTGVAAGPFAPTLFAGFTAPPNANNNTLIKSGMDMKATEATVLSQTQNLTQTGAKNPYSTNPYPSYLGISNSTTGSTTSGATAKQVASGAAVAVAAVLTVGAAVLV